MTIGIAREIAARLWCDPEMSHIPMDAYLCESIAWAIMACFRGIGDEPEEKLSE